jgi:exosortase A-associated hydrolase 1
VSTFCEQAVIFTCGGSRLVGVVHIPRNQASHRGVLVVVGGPQYRIGSHRQFLLMARSLAGRGYPVMRFDYRGMGDSEGETRGFEEIADDVRAAIEAFTASVSNLSQIVLFGLCDGASAIAMQAAIDERVGGIILVNPWVHTITGEAKAYVRQYYGRRLLQGSFWRKLLSGRVSLLRSGIDFLVALRHTRWRIAGPGTGEREIPFLERMRAGLERFERPVLILISGRDLTAAQFTALCRDDPRWSHIVARENVKLIRLDEADHTFSSRAMLDRAGETCALWLGDAAAASCGLRSGSKLSNAESA